ncbi:MAG TPA: NAD(P)H-binding protein, partial [Gaiellales bacterium]|nr:NAD(P)H-binding protein [Gaiellales bacterium]
MGVYDQLTAGRVLLTGATGYVGGRLLPALEHSERPLRCAVRTPDRLVPRVAAGTEVVAADMFDEASLERALADVDVAYYLVHSMSSDGEFEERDRTEAELFAAAARDQAVNRIVYLGGLGHGAGLSSHLESRQEVGRILAASGVETIDARNSIVST